MKFSPRTAGFTLVEVIVASGIVVVIMGVLISMTDQTQRLMRSTSAKVEQFQEARVAFESMTRRLAQATLNTYWDYRYDRSGLRPQSYQRSAELRFISGNTTTLMKGGGSNQRIRPGHGVFFHAPNGFVDDQKTFGALDHLINTWGYFVEIADDKETLPDFLVGRIPERRRYRLMELMQPSEDLKTYQFQVAGAADWFAPLVTQNIRPVRVLAENIVALFVLPRLSRADEQLWMREKGRKTIPQLAKNMYVYDTTDKTVADPVLNPRNQLPPVLQVVMVAIDEPSGEMLADKFAADPYMGINYFTMFRNPAILEDDPSTYKPGDGDLSKLEELLASKRVSYRVFSSNVSIRGAKWSRAQAN